MAPTHAAAYRTAEKLIKRWIDRSDSSKNLFLDLPNLEELPPLPPNLLSLSLVNVPKLRSLDLPPLQALSIDGASSLPASAFASLPSSLHTLHIKDTPLPDLRILPQGLKGLYLHLVDLEEFPAGFFPKLALLYIHNVKTLKAIHIPPSLTTLELEKLPLLTELTSFPSTLTSISLQQLPLTELPDFPAGIKNLFIMDLPITTLPPFPSPEVSVVCVQTRMPEELLPLTTTDMTSFGPYTYRSEEIDDWIRRINPILEEMQAKKRTQMRCALYAQELIAVSLSPERVAKWLGKGTVSDWELLDSMFGIM